jgi:hypothetical protein
MLQPLVRPRRAGQALALARLAMLPSTQRTVSASRGWCFRGSIPSLCAPLSTLRRHPRGGRRHDSGIVWFARPSLEETCTFYSLPVSRRTHCHVSAICFEMPLGGTNISIHRDMPISRFGESHLG